MNENPYIRIVKAAERGVGVRLTAEECQYLALDSSIAAVAALTSNGDESDGGSFIVTKRGFIDTPPPQSRATPPSPSPSTPSPRKDEI